MKRTLIIDSPQEVGKEIAVNGWIQTVRKHGKIAFFDVYDRSGLLQVVATTPEVLEQINKLEQRAAVKVIGKVKERGEKYINPDIPTGTIEMEESKVDILSLP